MRTKSFSVLRERMKPERRAKIEKRVQLALLHLTFLEQLKSLGYADEELEKELSNFDSTFSDLDSPEDIQVSALYGYIQALGGSLKLVANFPDKEIVLAQFE
ncbi:MULTISPECIES: transcriptional regulator [unclassified Microcoleus]|uniref:transcriptional regulator n=2 Tax=unclassified Microcoleus TaxID=2642155 RepID=UPI002FD4D148